MAGGFLPPVVMTVMADAKKFIDEQGKVVKAGDEASKKLIEQSEKNAAAAEAEAKKAQEAADQKMAAADKAAAAAEAAAARTEKAYAELAAATEEDQAKAAQAVEAATAKQEAALAKLDEALAAQTKAQDTAAAKAEEATARRSAAEEAAAQKTTAAHQTMGKVVTATGAVMGGAAVAVGAAAVDMAVHFQTSSTKLVTSAGESEGAIDTVRQGILSMAGEVGVSADQLSDAMYKVESAGYHGAAGLGLLKAAQEGAKAEGADGVKVADALSSALRDYYPHAQSAADVTAASTDVMSKFIGATSAGKMTFDDLAGSLNSILPVASAAKIDLSDVMGVLASMTVHGISADQATQNMADAIRHLQAPTQTMSKAMATLGIDSTDVAAKLGERGLSGTMQFLSEKVKAAMPPGTEKVILDLGNALSKSTPQVQDLGQKLMDGTITMKEFSQQAKELDPISGGQAMQFETLAKSTHQIGNQMISGADVMQTYGGTMAKVMGDATGLKVALMTTGENANYTNDAIKQVSGSTADAQGNVKGWADVQKNAGQSMAELQASIGSMAIELGTALLPVVKAAADGLKGFIDWANSNPAAFQALALGIMGVAVAFGALAIGMMAASVTPIGLAIAGIVLAVVALGAAIAWLVTHWNDVVGFITTIWNGFVGWIKSVIDGLVGWWHGVWEGGFGQVIRAVWDGIVNYFKIAIAVIYTIVVAPIVIYIHLLSEIFTWLYQNVIKPVWDGISQAMSAAWNWIYGNVIKPIMDYVDLVGKVFQALWNTYVVPVWNGIKDAIGAAWNWIVTNVMNVIHTEIEGLGIIFNWLHDNVIQPVWQNIQDSISAVWNWLSSNVFDPISHVIDGIGKGFDLMGQGIKRAWDGIVDAAKTPVKFMIDQVYNKGIMPVWNDVAGVVGLGKMDPIPLNFASGGVMPGYQPGVDSIHAMLSPGEAIMVPEWTKMVGPDRIFAMNHAARNGDTGSVKSMLGFANGGVVGDILGAIGGAVDALKSAALGGLKAAATPVVQGIYSLADGALGTTGFGGLLDSGVHKLGDGFLSFLGGKDSSAPKSSVGSPGAVSGDLAGWVTAAMAAAGVNGGNWTNGLEVIAMHESGGNPNATNNWDSNAAAGDPSRGLMQTIGSTFEAYRMASLPDDIFDPVANIVAGIHYIQSRYGDISNVPGLVSMAQGGPYVGYSGGGVTPVLYDEGGWLPPGRTLVQNNTGQPERVLAPGQGGHQINVNVQSPADPYRIGSELGFILLAQR